MNDNECAKVEHVSLQLKRFSMLQWCCAGLHMNAYIKMNANAWRPGRGVLCIFAVSCIIFWTESNQVTGELGFSGWPGLGLLGSSGSRETCHLTTVFIWKHAQKLSTNGNSEPLEELEGSPLEAHVEPRQTSYHLSHGYSPNLQISRSAQISPVTAAEGRLLLPKLKMGDLLHGLEMPQKTPILAPIDEIHQLNKSWKADIIYNIILYYRYRHR